MTPRVAVLMGAFALLLAPACNAGGDEGAPCNRAKGNADCRAGLVCTSNIDIAASTPRCCPPTPEQPTTSACAPAGEPFNPDASVTPISSGGSTGAGGTGGSDAGMAGSDAGMAGSDAGMAGSDAGMAGSDAGMAGSDAGGAAGSAADAGGD